MAQSALAVAGLSVVFRASNALEKSTRARQQSSGHLLSEIAFHLN